MGYLVNVVRIFIKGRLIFGIKNEGLSFLVADRRAASSFLGGGGSVAVFSVNRGREFDLAPGNRCDSMLKSRGEILTK
jgi:hypothetical protein